jgi:hypothetical protein
MARDQYRNRIVGQRAVPIDHLKPHPLNWRTHSDLQAATLESLMEHVGVVQTVVWNRRTGHILDGHLRVEQARRRGETEVGVTEVDLDEAEERVVLASFDSIGAMAGVNTDAFRDLADQIGTHDDWLKDLIANTSFAIGVDLSEPPEVHADEDEVPEPPKVPVTRPGDLWLLGGTVTCPKCGKTNPVERAIRTRA